MLNQGGLLNELIVLIIMLECGQNFHDLTGVALLRLPEANAYAYAHNKEVEILELSLLILAREVMSDLHFELIQILAFKLTIGWSLEHHL